MVITRSIIGLFGIISVILTISIIVAMHVVCLIIFIIYLAHLIVRSKVTSLRQGKAKKIYFYSRFFRDVKLRVWSWNRMHSKADEE